MGKGKDCESEWDKERERDNVQVKTEIKKKNLVGDLK